MSTATFRFADLFAGLGGFHVALKRLGGECVFAAEIKPSLRQLYNLNFGLVPAGDIKSVAPEDIPDHDVLTAGFPCQPFSKAGEQLGFECTAQGQLFYDVANILKAKRPRFFILENVPNLLKHNGGRTWIEICRLLGNEEGGAGYYIENRRLSPHHFGIPQIRDRVYIVGSLSPLNNLTWPSASASEPTNIASVLDTRPPEAKALSQRVTKCLEVWQRFLDSCPAEVDLPYFPLWSMEWGATYPFESTTPFALKEEYGLDGLKGFKGSHGRKIGLPRTLQGRWDLLPSHARTEQKEFPDWKKKFIRYNRNFYQENKEWIDEWLPQILEFPSSLQKLEWNMRAGPRNIWQYVIQFRASGVRVKQRSTAPSLIAMTDTQVPIIGWEKRYMTPRECARLQSMDTIHHLPESSTQAFHALGNAVNADVVEQVACALMRTQQLE